MHKIILTQFESVGNQDEIMYDTEIYQKNTIKFDNEIAFISTIYLQGQAYIILIKKLLLG